MSENRPIRTNQRVTDVPHRSANNSCEPFPLYRQLATRPVRPSAFSGVLHSTWQTSSVICSISQNLRHPLWCVPFRHCASDSCLGHTDESKSAKCLWSNYEVITSSYPGLFVSILSNRNISISSHCSIILQIGLSPKRPPNLLPLVIQRCISQRYDNSKLEHRSFRFQEAEHIDQQQARGSRRFQLRCNSAAHFSEHQSSSSMNNSSDQTIRTIGRK